MIIVCRKHFSLIAGNLKTVNVSLSYRQIVPKFKTLLHRRTFYFPAACRSSFTEKVTRFNGVYVTIEDKEQDAHVFKDYLSSSLKKWKDEQRRSVLLQVPISQSHMIRIASDFGFVYHHARNDKAVLSLWLVKNTESKIPMYANHQVGVAGACFNSETNEVLLVRDKGRYSNWWKFPGGFSNVGEFIGETAVREVFEETGIEAEFKSVLSLRQMHGAIFGQSDFYFICRLHPLSYNIMPCPDEIEACQWTNVDTILHMNDATPFVKLVCRLIMQGRDEGFDKVDIAHQKLEHWIFKNKNMALYHRPLE